jgi:hypothetical protein
MSSNRFPLRLHATGQWTKHIRGRDYYFGTDKDAALARYVHERAALEAGRVVLRTSVAVGSGPSVADLCNLFLTARRGRVEIGEMTPGMWSQYLGACRKVVDEFGRETRADSLTAGDFGKLRLNVARRLGPRALACRD